MSHIFIRHLAIAGGAILALTGASLAAPVQSIETELGAVLADKEGFALYTFRNDEPGVSNCYETCAANWPPFYAEDGAAEGNGFTLVERDDGTVQWAQDDWPLYYWVNDIEPGDVTGDGVNEVWDVARP